MSQENLTTNEGIKKLQELAIGIDFALFATNLGVQAAHAVPMSTKEVDEEGNIWFLSNKNSEHNKHIAEQGVAQLYYGKGSSMEFLTVFGKATISTDKSIIEQLYVKSDDSWFDGKDDPNVSIIRIQPTDVYYWDSKVGKFVSMLHFLTAIVTGTKADNSDGVEGKIEIYHKQESTK